jgi:hypothetical protein
MGIPGDYRLVCSTKYWRGFYFSAQELVLK